jgi:hypothetical protein
MSIEAVSFSETLLFTNRDSVMFRKTESVQIIISFLCMALAQVKALQVFARWLILCILEVLEGANHSPVAGYRDRGVSWFSSEVHQADMKIVL